MQIDLEEIVKFNFFSLLFSLWAQQTHIKNPRKSANGKWYILTLNAVGHLGIFDLLAAI